MLCLYEHLRDELVALPDHSMILLRAAKDGTPQLFEALASRIAGVLGIQVVWFTPEGHGRESVFFRDYRLVEAADALVAYFDSARIMDGGTGHVVEAALNREVPVTAWSVGHTTFERIGEVELSDLIGQEA